MKLEGFRRITREFKEQCDLYIRKTAYVRLSKEMVDKYKLEKRFKTSVFINDNGHIVLSFGLSGDITLQWSSSGCKAFYLPKKYGYLEGIYDLVEDDIDESINRVWLKFSKREEL
ncbi:MAG: hypothetical protein II453_03440 [Alphaproteobacteria bacterium]|nr:hypothetical protein [Alphaproteobacteria bacterium]